MYFFTNDTYLHLFMCISSEIELFLRTSGHYFKQCCSVTNTTSPSQQFPVADNILWTPLKIFLGDFAFLQLHHFFTLGRQRNETNPQLQFPIQRRFCRKSRDSNAVIKGFDVIPSGENVPLCEYRQISLGFQDRTQEYATCGVHLLFTRCLLKRKH